MNPTVCDLKAAAPVDFHYLVMHYLAPTEGTVTLIGMLFGALWTMVFTWKLGGRLLLFTREITPTKEERRWQTAEERNRERQKREARLEAETRAAYEALREMQRNAATIYAPGVSIQEAAPEPPRRRRRTKAEIAQARAEKEYRAARAKAEKEFRSWFPAGYSADQQDQGQSQQAGRK